MQPQPDERHFAGDHDPVPGPCDNADDTTMSDAGLTVDIGAVRPPEAARPRRAQDDRAPGKHDR